MKKEESNDVLRATNITINYGKGDVLHDLNFSIKKGELIGMVGMSGVGKTSLLKALIGFLPLHKGRITYRSPTYNSYLNVSTNAKQFQRLLGFAAQTPSYYPELSVEQNLAYFASLYGVPQNIQYKNIKRVLTLVQLLDQAATQAKYLSGGMKKRLDIAVSMVHNPLILILDEPTADMDPMLRMHLWNVIEEINKQGTTVIVASHFLSEIEHTCDRILFLHDKKLVFQGTTATFRDYYKNVKEVHIETKDGTYDIILKKALSLSQVEVKHVFKKRGRIVLHSTEKDRQLRAIITKLVGSEKNVDDIEIRSPSLDMLFKLYTKK